MNISLGTGRKDANVTQVTLRFDIIDQRAAEILHLPLDKVTDRQLGELIGKTRETISRLRNRRYMPAFQTALDIANVLGLPVEEITDAPQRPGSSR